MKHKGLWISLISVFGTLAIVYLAGAFVFSGYSLPKTSVTGIDREMGWLKKDQISEIIESALPERIKTTFPDGYEYSIDLTAFRNDEKINNTGQEIIGSQDHWKWPIEVLSEHVYSYSPEDFYDRARMLSEMDNYTALYESGVPAEDASIQIDSLKHSYTMEQEIEGTVIDRDGFTGSILDLVFGRDVFSHGLEYDFAKDIYVKPQITTENEQLNIDYNWLKSLADREISIDFDGATEKIKAGDFYDLKTLMDEGEIVINDDLINEHVRKYADKYDTLDKDRIFRNHNGELIAVGGRWDEFSNYGYRMDQEKTAEIIHEALLSFDSNEIKPEWNSKGHSHYADRQNDIGDTYIEVSLAEQHLWYWKDGRLFLETDVVTGLPRDGRNTSRGVFEIYSEGKHVNLKGTMNGETWDSWVDFWFTVTDTQIGIHDAPWRKEFGGNIYTYNGSHGCVNLPRPAMEMLYNNAGIGTLVVIY